MVGRCNTPQCVAGKRAVHTPCNRQFNTSDGAGAKAIGGLNTNDEAPTRDVHRRSPRECRIRPDPRKKRFSTGISAGIKHRNLTDQ